MVNSGNQRHCFKNITTLVEGYYHLPINRKKKIGPLPGAYTASVATWGNIQNILIHEASCKIKLTPNMKTVPMLCLEAKIFMQFM